MDFVFYKTATYDLQDVENAYLFHKKGPELKILLMFDWARLCLSENFSPGGQFPRKENIFIYLYEMETFHSAAWSK